MLLLSSHVENRFELIFPVDPWEVFNRLVTGESSFLAPPASGSLIQKLFQKPRKKWRLLKNQNRNQHRFILSVTYFKFSVKKTN
jgi:hypothetical protein